MVCRAGRRWAALAHNGYDNNVSDNVLQRLASSEPL